MPRFWRKLLKADWRIARTVFRNDGARLCTIPPQSYAEPYFGEWASSYVEMV